MLTHQRPRGCSCGQCDDVLDVCSLDQAGLPASRWTSTSGPPYIRHDPRFPQQVLVPNVWTRLSGTFTVPAYRDCGLSYIGSNANALLVAGDTLDISAYLVESSPVLGAYFDGTVTSPDSDLTRAWTGNRRCFRQRLEWHWRDFDGARPTVGVRRPECVRVSRKSFREIPTRQATPQTRGSLATPSRSLA